MKGKKQISLLLAICFSVYLGHNLIPHHHHTETINQAGASDCPVHHEDHHDPGGHPMHCHAFNSVDMLKYSTYEVNEPIQEVDQLTALFTDLSLEKPADLKVRLYTSRKIPDPTAEYPGGNSLRAPPVSV